MSNDRSATAADPAAAEWTGDLVAGPPPVEPATDPLLDRLAIVDPRVVWKHEAYDFTMWLLANADVLGDVLGMDLELTEAEHKVGGFALDLIGRDVSTGERIIVENQLEVTDHSHLGQILTYAGGTDPVTIVWCSPRFRDEHRAALTWLNERTTEDTRFFGVEISVVRIGTSRPAPLFRLVAQPNDWGKQVRSSVGPLTDRAALYRSFWGRLLDRIHTEHPSWTRAAVPTTASWMALPAGTSTAWYGFSFTGTRALRSELYFGSPDPGANRDAFDRLFEARDRFEGAYGRALAWEPLEGKKACRVAEYRPNSSVENSDEWDQFINWLFEASARMRRAVHALGGLAG